jgi:hypothetical protein
VGLARPFKQVVHCKISPDKNGYTLWSVRYADPSQAQEFTSPACVHFAQQSPLIPLINNPPTPLWNNPLPPFPLNKGGQRGLYKGEGDGVGGLWGRRGLYFANRPKADR